MMGDKLFRSDLYYRLKVFPITTPPLREHTEDIPLLARHFTRKYAAKMDRQIDTIPAETMKALMSWSWPGNVRELENFIERSVILSRGPALRAPLSELRADAPEAGGNATLEDVERDHIVRIFRETGGVISATATRLGIPRTTLNAMMKKLGISSERSLKYAPHVLQPPNSLHLNRILSGILLSGDIFAFDHDRKPLLRIPSVVEVIAVIVVDVNVVGGIPVSRPVTRPRIDHQE